MLCIKIVTLPLIFLLLFLMLRFNFTKKIFRRGGGDECCQLIFKYCDIVDNISVAFPFLLQLNLGEGRDCVLSNIFVNNLVTFLIMPLFIHIWFLLEIVLF